MTRPIWPGDARFAFTVFDDADSSTVANTAPVYRLLADLGLRTTKSVWVLPSRGSFAGESLHDAGYRQWILELQAEGFEIGLHNVGDGAFGREEILAALEEYRSVLGSYPRVHTNHVSNPDCLYWWDRRFEFPVSAAYRLAFRVRSGRARPLAGEDPESPHYWADAAKEHVDYIRNLTFNGIDTLAADPRMPYFVDSKRAGSNRWFSSTDGQRLAEFRDLITPANLDRLEARGGACIVYTHFGSDFVDSEGRVDPLFRERLTDLASRRGWFVPVGRLLDHLATGTSGKDPGYAYRLARNLRWAVDRIEKRRRYGR
jgi:hypothetical protein